ncbi:MAG: hypothetical protein KDD25_00670 [Bdellovibrionales bacterium]|nr:hypothetical protein [Bdellovibrionales bacterium]
MKKMSVKKTIAALAITAASSNAVAMRWPGSQDYENKTVCLSSYTDSNGLLYSGDCDNTANNVKFDKEILANGCAEKQSALATNRTRAVFPDGTKGEWSEWSLEVPSCPDPRIVQL